MDRDEEFRTRMLLEGIRERLTEIRQYLWIILVLLSLLVLPLVWKALGFEPWFDITKGL